MKNRVFESIVRFKIGPCSIRVWRSEASLGAFSNQDLIKWAKQQQKLFSTGLFPIRTREDLLRRLLTFKRVAAIEVTDVEGFGCLVYNDWP
jgi:hypothetical protein